MKWKPNSQGAAKYSIIFTNHSAWLIIKPMKNWLDVKVYWPKKTRPPRSGAITNTATKWRITSA